MKKFTEIKEKLKLLKEQRQNLDSFELSGKGKKDFEICLTCKIDILEWILQFNKNNYN